MRIFGKERSSRWVVLGSVLLVLASVAISPLMRMAFFLSNNLAGVVLGPPAIWNRPRQMPSVEDLAGNYIETSRNLDRSFSERNASLELHRDGTMRVSDLPYEQMNQQLCQVSGLGSWSKSFDGDHLDLRLTSTFGEGQCPEGDYSGFAIAGHIKPYSLYWIVSDSNSGTGVWLASNR